MGHEIHADTHKQKSLENSNHRKLIRWRRWHCCSWAPELHKLNLLVRAQNNLKTSICVNTFCEIHDLSKFHKGRSTRTYPLVLCPIHVIFDLKNRTNQVCPAVQTVACKGNGWWELFEPVLLLCMPQTVFILYRPILVIYCCGSHFQCQHHHCTCPIEVGFQIVHMRFPVASLSYSQTPSQRSVTLMRTGCNRRNLAELQTSSIASRVGLWGKHFWPWNPCPNFMCRCRNTDELVNLVVQSHDSLGLHMWTYYYG